ncbi:MAG: SDR family NAD(P)-dependent oxidoreductase, partial [Reyranella sp.]|nr:SDR family NAD(P)-dependent oxidoreductase [Reyranella sp.]
MNVKGQAAIVTGGASGLGGATASALAAAGAKVAIFDLQDELGEAKAREIGGLYLKTNVADAANTEASVKTVVEKLGAPRVAVNCAGIGRSGRTISKSGPHDLAMFTQVIQVNLIGTFNVIRLASFAMSQAAPMDDGERGVIINTASVAAFEGQIGQAAYSASKGGVVGMTLPIARDLASLGIRGCPIAPGLFLPPSMMSL